MITISIGLLLPSSTILPMGKDFEKGLTRTLKEKLEQKDWDVEIIPEFIGQGSKSSIEEAVNKLIGYHQVDVITGILSNRVAVDVAEKFEKHGIPLLVNNIGEHIPNPKAFNPYVFINSTHTWQQVWSLGYWGASTFGRRGMFVGSIYDAGYSFTSMLKLGMEAADSQCAMPFSIAPLSPNKKTSDPAVVFQHINEFRPDFVFSAFCGGEASVFLQEYARSGYHKKMPLLALPFLLQPFDADGEELEVYTAVTSTRSREEVQLNIDKLNTDSPFSELGSETGIILSEAFKTKGSRSLTEALRESNCYTTSGALHIDSSWPGRGNGVYLVKNTHKGDRRTIKMTVQKTLKTIEITDKELVKCIEEPSSGWGNPYLGI